MGKIDVWQCDDCKVLIMPSSNSKEQNGYIVRGAICAAEGDGNGGLLGDRDLKTCTYCKSCFCKALGIHMAAMR